MNWPDRYGNPDTYYEGDNAIMDLICTSCGEPAEELDEYGECPDCASGDVWGEFTDDEDEAL